MAASDALETTIFFFFKEKQIAIENEIKKIKCIENEEDNLQQKMKSAKEQRDQYNLESKLKQSNIRESVQSLQRLNDIKNLLLEQAHFLNQELDREIYKLVENKHIQSIGIKNLRNSLKEQTLLLENPLYHSYYEGKESRYREMWETETSNDSIAKANVRKEEDHYEETDNRNRFIIEVAKMKLQSNYIKEHILHLQNQNFRLQCQKKELRRKEKSAEALFNELSNNEEINTLFHSDSQTIIHKAPETIVLHSTPKPKEPLYKANLPPYETCNNGSQQNSRLKAPNPVKNISQKVIEPINNTTANEMDPKEFITSNEIEPRKNTTMYGTEPIKNTTMYGTEPIKSTTLYGTEPIKNTTMYGTEPIKNTTLYGTEPIKSTALYGTEPIKNTTVNETEPIKSATLYGTEPIKNTTVKGTGPIKHTTLNETELIEITTMYAKKPIEITTLNGTEPIINTTLYAKKPIEITTMNLKDPIEYITPNTIEPIKNTTLKATATIKNTVQNQIESIEDITPKVADTAGNPLKLSESLSFTLQNDRNLSSQTQNFNQPSQLNNKISKLIECTPVSHLQMKQTDGNVRNIRPDKGKLQPFQQTFYLLSGQCNSQIATQEKNGTQGVNNLKALSLENSSNSSQKSNNVQFSQQNTLDSNYLRSTFCQGNDLYSNNSNGEFYENIPYGESFPTSKSTEDFQKYTEPMEVDDENEPDSYIAQPQEKLESREIMNHSRIQELLNFKPNQMTNANYQNMGLAAGFYYNVQSDKCESPDDQPFSLFGSTNNQQNENVEKKGFFTF